MRTAFSVGGGSDDSQVGLRWESAANSVAHDLLIVGDDDANAHVADSPVGSSV
jgi:hypothetical protein